MRFFTLVPLFLILISPFISYASSQNEEHFPALMFLVIEPEGPAIAEIEPMDHYSFKFKFYNGGYFQRNLYAFWTEFKVTVEGKGWSAYVSPAYTYLYPSEKKYGIVNVAAGARPSNFAYIHLYGRFRDIYGFWHHANYTFQVRTTQYHSFDASVKKVFVEARQDEIYSIPITVRNFGNYEDVFYLDTYYIPPEWHITFVDSSLVIPPGGKATTYMYFVTPHESVYLQHSTYLLRIKVSASGASPKLVTMIVSMEGWNFTPAQIVAFAASVPSIFMISIVMAFARYYGNECNFIPKPWKEYKEELMKMAPDERKKAMKTMKEEWLSSYYYCREEKKRKERIERLRKTKERKERKLQRKLHNEWEKSWKDIEKKWVKEKERIERFYNDKKGRIEKMMHGKKFEIEMPKIEYPQKPKKVEMPEIPKYLLDEEKGILIEPDEISLKRIKMAIRNNKIIIEGEKERIERISEEIIRKLEIEFKKLEDKIKAGIKKERKEIKK